MLFLAYLAGGYVAGRMARFDGAKQGIAVWVIGLLVVIALAVLGAVLGAEYNVLTQLNLPSIPLSGDTLTTAGIIAGVAARKVIVASWKAAKKTDPPTNPAARDTQWGEALIWTIATSIGVGIARLIATRGAAAGWEKATGGLPPGLQEVSP